MLLQPRQQHYHFADSALPSRLFAGRVGSMLLGAYPDGMVAFLRRLWEAAGERFPPEECLPPDALRVTAHRIGGKHPVLLIHMPPPERDLEAHFVATVFTPTPRYFTLGKSPSLPGDEESATTLREVDSQANHNLGPGPAPIADAFLAHLCGELHVPPVVEQMADHEVRDFAPRVPSSGPSLFDRPPKELKRLMNALQPRAQGTLKKRWWGFWK